MAEIAVEARIARCLGGAWRAGERVQELWSGYGEIRRYLRVDATTGASGPASVVVKRVQPPASGRAHPRAWGTDLGHRRKLRSYEVERAFYEGFAGACDARCRVARPYALAREEGEWLFVLEDLDASGFARRCARVCDEDLVACLRWLAEFHARFVGRAPDGLWETGCYWHLATRPEELEAMPDGPLRRAAAAIDARLEGARYKTIVHGDAKLANFCFGEHEDAASRHVAAVDFQYVGGGCGIKDVAYFLSSCFDEGELERRADGCLELYFDELARALERAGFGAVPELCAEWRALYDFAWADFCRFLQGWAPTHAKLHGYSLRRSEAALRATPLGSDPRPAPDGV